MKTSYMHRLGILWAALALVAGLAAFFLVPARAQEAAPGWSAPINLSHAETNSHYPNLAIDPAGGLHVIWTEGDGQDDAIFYTHLDTGGWTEPVDILITPGGGPAYEPTMAADERGYLHVVWRGAGTMFYSSAYAPAAGSASHWSMPQIIAPLDSNAGSPHLVVDRAGTLHLVYAQPPGHDNGIFYLAGSAQDGSWPAPAVVHANPHDDRMVMKPRLAAGPDGTLYVVWAETGYPTTFPPLGIYLAISADGGQTWSDPFPLAEGPYDDPGIIVRGQREVHVVWSGTAGDRFKFHRWSPDGGRTWSEMWRNTDLGGIQGWPALVLDSNQTLHWLMVGTVFSTQNDSLYYTTWTEGGWSPGIVVLPGIATTGQNPAFVSAAVAGGNMLHLVLVYPLDTPQKTWQTDIFYLNRRLDSPPTTVRPLPAPTVPAPTLPPTRSPTATADLEATAAPPVPTVAGEIAPPQGDTLPLLLVALAPAVGLVALVILVHLLRQGRPRER